MLKKINIKEILFILIIAIGLGLVYNYSQPKPLTLIYKKKEVAKVSDDVLFGNGNSKKDDIAANELSEESVTYEQMLKIIGNDDFIIIDARSSDFFQKNRIGNSINIFPYDDESVVIHKILDLPHDKTFIVYCDGGNCDSSHKIAELLMNFGYKAHIYSGGWDEWSKKKGIE